MKVILLKTQEVKDVADGYARNYLMPAGLAVPATEERLKEAEKIKLSHNASARNRVITWDERLKDFGEHPVVIHAAANDDGTLFGAVSKSAILEVLATRGLHIGEDVEESWLAIDKPIKSLGAHTVGLRIPNTSQKEFMVNIERT